MAEMSSRTMSNFRFDTVIGYCVRYTTKLLRYAGSYAATGHARTAITKI